MYVCMYVCKTISIVASDINFHKAGIAQDATYEKQVDVLSSKTRHVV